LRPALAALLLALASGAAARERIDDSDFSRPQVSARSAAALPGEGRRDGNVLIFPLSAPAATASAAPGAIAGRVLLAGRDGTLKPARLAKVRLAGASGAWTPVGSDGGFILTGARSGVSNKISVSLDNPRWAFRSDNDKTYEWEAGPFADGADVGPLSPVPGTENSKLGVLHLTYLEALDFLAREATDDWWKKPLTVVWPGGSDYFEPGAWTLHLTDPMAWDVVLHELGHAVMDGAMDARTSGGSHKIDECYSAGLAWSEGWATFFAGAVRLSPDDPDAKFEFLVPRRAPIRLENVPADVCRGPNNEWRVAAGLWDIYDRHPDDGDAVVLPFRTLWAGVTGGVTRNVGDAWTLTASRLDPLARRAGEDAMIANSLLDPRPSGLTVSVDAALRGMMLRDAASLQSPRGR
jgi:hypothetical protein